MNEYENKPFDRTAHIESFNTREGINDIFIDNKTFIESYCGIKLTNIELAGLRIITEKVMSDVYRQEKEKDGNPEKKESLSDMLPTSEIPARFFLEFYGLYPEDIDKLEKENGEEIFKEYFRRRQNSLHLI